MMQNRTGRIIRAEKHHLLDAMFIYKSCVREMNERELFNWNTAYPSQHGVLSDIRDESLYIYIEKHTSIGVVCLNAQEPEEYRDLKWNYDGPSLFVHRMAVHPSWRNLGVAEKMMNFAYQFAKENHFNSIRLDAIIKNPQAIRLYEKCGYEKVNTIHLSYQKDKFRCMELKI